VSFSPTPSPSPSPSVAPSARPSVIIVPSILPETIASPDPSVVPYVGPIASPTISKTPTSPSFIADFTAPVAQSPATTAATVALAAAVAVPAMLFSGLANLRDILRWPLVLLSRIKKRPKWGVVYDSSTKQPIYGARIQIYDNNGRLRETIYSGKDGSFGFLVPAGSYKITASKYGFSFPSNIVPGKIDNQYQGLYHGEMIELPEDVKKGDTSVPIYISIPMDQLYLSAARRAHIASEMVFGAIMGKIRLPILIIGTLLSLDALIVVHRWYDYLIMAVYVVLWVFEIREFEKPKMFGTVEDTLGNPVNLPIVRATDKIGRLKSTVIGRQDGKFTMSLEPGEYVFEVSRLGYITQKTELTRIVGISDLGRLKIRLKRIVINYNK
jgi:hypothetical protein